MIVNAHEPGVASKMDSMRREATRARVLDLASSSAVGLRVEPASAHLELGGDEPVAGRPNRALVKVFEVGGGLWAAFFYKRSQIPGSADRYAYGVVEFDGSGPDPVAAESWFRWIHEGFHPERQPPGLKRAFTYTVPEG